jgi:hypothetical protein
MKNKLFVLTALVLGMSSLTLYADIHVRDAGANVIYQYSNGLMYQGVASKGNRIFKYDDRQDIIMDMSNKTAAKWNEKDKVLSNGRNRPMYALDGDKIRMRNNGGKVVGYIDGRKIYQGSGPNRKLILYPDSPLPNAVALYLFHVATADPNAKADDNEDRLQVDFSKVPYGYYLGAKGEGPIVLSLRGDTIYYGEDLKTVAYNRKGLCFYKDGNTGAPDFCLDKNGALYKGSERTPQNRVMHLEWFNCYAEGKTGTDAIGTLQYVGENILTEGYTQPSQRPDFTGKRILLSSTLPNNRVALELRIFLVYLTQLDPEFKAYLDSRK